MKILHKTELVHPFFLLIFIGTGAFIGLADYDVFEFWKKDFIELLPSISIIFISFFILNALNTSLVVAIKNEEIIKGIFCIPFGFLKINERIKISDIIEVELRQNEKLYYEIIAESNSEKSLLIKSIANKIPAEKELNRIASEINTICQHRV